MLHVIIANETLAHFSSANDKFDVSFAGLSSEELLEVDDAMGESECRGCDNFTGLSFSQLPDSRCVSCNNEKTAYMCMYIQCMKRS